MSDLTTAPTCFMGCDVGKTEIVVFDSKTARTRRIGNDPDALAAFAAALDSTALVICEATAGDEAALLDVLVGAGQPAIGPMLAKSRRSSADTGCPGSNEVWRCE